MALTIGRNGRVSGARLVRRSGNAAVDRAALSAVRLRFPAFPSDIARASLSFTVPLSVR